MNHRFNWTPFWALAIATHLATTTLAQEKTPTPSLANDLAAIGSIGREASGYQAASAASLRLAKLSPDQVGQVLTAMSDASSLAKNWLRMVAADVADNGDFPGDELRSFLSDRAHEPDARHAAFQMLVANDPSLQDELIKDAADDPSLPIRYLAIADLLQKAEVIKAEPVAAIALLRKVIANGRNPDQLQSAAKSLDDLGTKIELADELGLIRNWVVIGTYDNTGSTQFETVYPPEQTYLATGSLPSAWLIDQAEIPSTQPATKPAVTKLVTSDDSMGMVNLNPAFENAKDVVVYCYAEFEIDATNNSNAPNVRPAVARIGCITANQVWVNGKLATANDVYHSGSRIDQYLGDCELVAGKNTVLVKVFQNAQTEPWAQDWQFQFRFTDPVGAALQPTIITKP